MAKSKKIYVSIYCKIYTDSFSDEMIDREATGDQTYKFLLKDAKQCFDADDQLIPGDKNIWYLGCNEKFGHMRFGDKLISWSFGESSFDLVEHFVTELFSAGIFSVQQYQDLMSVIDEGRTIDNMYLISDYLICRNAGGIWSKPSDIPDFRDGIKLMVSGTKESFTKNNYKIYL